jgi:hypothetical protein
MKMKKTETRTTKRAYIAPSMELFPVEAEVGILAGSGNPVSGTNGVIGGATTGDNGGAGIGLGPTGGSSPSPLSFGRTTGKTTTDELSFD